MDIGLNVWENQFLLNFRPFELLAAYNGVWRPVAHLLVINGAPVSICRANTTLLHAGRNSNGLSLSLFACKWSKLYKFLKKVAQNSVIATSTLYSFLLHQPNNWWKMAYILCWVKYFLERKQKMFYGCEIQYKVRLYIPTSYKILNNPWGAVVM